MPDPSVVVNTSPLVYLHRVGQLDLLRNFYGEITVPEAVCVELATGRALGHDVPSPETAPWMVVRQAKARPILPMLVDLGAGESEVLALAQETAARLVVLDDRLARRMASLLGLRVTGAVGLLIKARLDGRMPSIGPLLESHREKGMWLSDPLVRDVKAQLGE